DVGLNEGEREVTGGRGGGTAPVVAEIDRSRCRRHEAPGTERSGHGVRRAGHQAAGDPETEASERYLSAGAVRRCGRGPAEGALEGIHQEGRSGAATNLGDLGVQ